MSSLPVLNLAAIRTTCPSLGDGRPVFSRAERLRKAEANLSTGLTGCKMPLRTMDNWSETGGQNRRYEAYKCIFLVFNKHKGWEDGFCRALRSRVRGRIQAECP